MADRARGALPALLRDGRLVTPSLPHVLRGAACHHALSSACRAGEVADPGPPSRDDRPDLSAGSGTERRDPPGDDGGLGDRQHLVAARSRGWAPIGVEPSRWASARARERSLTVYTRELGAAVELLDPEAFRLVVCCDVLEHLADPGAALDVMHHLLEPGGMLYLT